MGLSLGNLGKKIWDTLGHGVDAVVPGDQSFLYNKPSPAAQQVIQRASQVGRAVSRGPIGVLGLGASKAAQLDRQAIGGFENSDVAASIPLVKPVTSFVNKNIIDPQLVSAQRLGQSVAGQNPYSSGTRGIGQFAGDLANVASFAPLGLGAKGGSLAVRTAKAVGAGAPIGVVSSAGQNLASGQPINFKDAAISGGITGGLNALPVVGPAIGNKLKAGYRGNPTLASEAGAVKVPTPEPVTAPASGRVAVAPTTNGPAQQVKQRFSDADQVILDQLKKIDKADPNPVGQPSRVDQFMYNSNTQRGSNATANQLLSKSENLQAALGGLDNKSYQAFSDYANARTELGSGAPKTSLSRPAAELQATIDNGQNAFGARFDALNQHYKDLADAAHQAGLISKETLNKYKADNNYIRIQRDMGNLLPDSFGKGNSYSIGSTILGQHRKGSTRDILPAGETAAQYTQQVYREMTKNRTATHLLDNLSKHGLAEKLDGAAAARHENVAKLIRNGQVEYYRVSPDMKEALNNINPYHMNVVTQILAAPGRLLRAGVTGLNPVFIARNLLKDQVGSAINSEHIAATHTPKAFFSGLFNAVTDAVGSNNNPIYQDFLRHYGDTTSYDLTRNIADSGKVISRIRGGKKVAIGQAIKSPIRTLENIASVTEKSTRFQNYRGEYTKAIKQGLPPEQASQRAAIAAWQNSVDFSRAGTWGRAINTVVPYWNPATQGVRQMARTLTKHPIKSGATATALVGVPLAAATAWNLSNPDTASVYANIPEYEKENNLILVPPGTTQNADGSYDVIKVPLAPGWKDLFMPARRAMEAFYHDKPLEFGKMATDILRATGGPVSLQSPGAFVGSFIPQAVKPVIQQYANQDLFSGNKIVPDYMQSATDAQGNPVPESQKAYPHSSGTAKAIGNLLGASPIRVEKAIKDVAGTVGINVLNAADATANISQGGVLPIVGALAGGSGFKKSFGSAQGIDNANKSAGAKYYDNLKQVTSGLNTNEQSAFNSLHPNKKNFLGDTITEADSTYNPAARLDIYNRYPKVFAADKALDQKNRDAGKPGNPLFDLAPEQVKKVLEKDNLPPGAKDPELSNLYNQPWYQDYQARKSAYFTAINKQAEAAGKPIAKGDNPYPATDPKLQQVMDYYSSLPKGTGARKNWINTHPAEWQAMQNQFAAIDNWQNVQRGKRGLAATEGAQGQANGYGSTSSSSKYSRGGKSGSGGSGGSNPYKYAVSINAGGSVKRPKVTVRSNGNKVAKRGKVSGPKVTTKKSLV